MNLHEVRMPDIQALAWLYPVGGNGRLLTPMADRSWNAIGHVYPVNRATPPDEQWSRQYWHPWEGGWGNRNWGADPLQPLCGRIRSRSRQAGLRAFGPGMLEDRQCPDCRRLAPNATYIGTLNAQDPWSQIGYTDRRFTRDPITGL